MDSEQHRIAASERIEEAASRWFARREGGTWGEADQAELEAWLAKETAHRIAYIRLEAAWNYAARMKALGAGVPAGVIPERRMWGDQIFFKGLANDGYPSVVAPAPIEPTEPRGKGRRSMWAVAASVVLALAATAWVWTTGMWAAGDRYSTRVGAINIVPLADGSHVTLNTDSRIRVDLEQKRRRIELDRGEAFFEVAKDSTRPFVVVAGDKRVIAVGTKFSVRREGNDILVAVAEGKVRVETSNALGGSDVPLLAAGDVAQVTANEVLIREHAEAAVEDALSWRKGYLVFRGKTLADAVAEFNRYNTRKILIEDPSIASIRIGGTFQPNHTEGFLWLLENGFPITVERKEHEAVLRRR
jgi:transmembrane sensor